MRSCSNFVNSSLPKHDNATSVMMISQLAPPYLKDHAPKNWATPRAQGQPLRGRPNRSRRDSILWMRGP